MTKKCRTHKATTKTKSCSSGDQLHAVRRKTHPSPLSMKTIGVDGSRTKLKLLEIEPGRETVPASPRRRKNKKSATTTSNRKDERTRKSKSSKKQTRKTSMQKKTVKKTKKKKTSKTATNDDNRRRSNSDLTDSTVTGRSSDPSVTTKTTTRVHSKEADSLESVVLDSSTRTSQREATRKHKNDAKSSKSELKKEKVDDQKPNEKSKSSKGKNKKKKKKNEKPEGKQQKCNNQNGEVVIAKSQNSKRENVSHGPKSTTKIMQKGPATARVSKKKKNKKRCKQAKKGANQREVHAIDRAIVKHPGPKERRRSSVKKKSDTKKKTKQPVKASKKSKGKRWTTTTKVRNRVDSVERPVISLKHSSFLGPTTHLKVARQKRSWRLLLWSLQQQRSMANHIETTWTSKRSITFMQEAESCFLTSVSTTTSGSTDSSSSLSLAENNGNLPWFVNRSNLNQEQNYRVKNNTRPERTMEMIFFDSNVKKNNFGRMTTNSK